MDRREPAAWVRRMLRQSLATLGEPDAVLRAAAALLGPALGADRIAIGEVAEDGQSLIVLADWTGPALPGGLPAAAPRDADLAVPLLRAGRRAAVLFAQSVAPRAWTEAEAELAAEVAERSWDAVERIRADQARRASEERLSLAIDAADIASWDVDLVTGRRVWSRSHFTLLGLDPAVDRASEAAWFARIAPQDRAAVTAGVAAARAGDGFYLAEYRILRADTGQVRWMHSRGRMLGEGAGQWRRFVGISLDVTERRHAEDRLRGAAEELERRVAARTAELAAARDRLVAEAAERERLEEQLRQTQKLQAVGQLAGGVAHDFNNLLTAVLGSLELLERHVTTDTGHRLLTAARSAAERGGALTNQLLVFARRQKLAMRPLDPADLLRHMEDLLRRTLGGMVALRLELPEQSCAVMTDPVQLELSVINLAINARDAMAGAGTLTIAVRRATVVPGTPDLADGPHIVIAVADTGPGMPEEVRARAFEPFFTTKDVGRGTGLGLAQVYGLARQSGGTARIAAASGAAAGTTVEIWLPCVAVPPAANAAASPQPAAATRPPAAAVLLVDDEAQVLAFAAEVLRDAGYEVIEAPDAQAALAVLSGGARIDLLATDFAMPGMTGTALIAAARRLRPGLPALLVSGYAEIGAGSDAAQAQLRKPFRGADLRAAVAELLARRTPAQPLVAPAVNPAM